MGKGEKVLQEAGEPVDRAIVEQVVHPDKSSWGANTRESVRGERQRGPTMDRLQSLFPNHCAAGERNQRKWE